jgi:hypothetical protein
MSSDYTELNFSENALVGPQINDVILYYFNRQAGNGYMLDEAIRKIN